MQGKLSFTTFALCKETSKGKTAKEMTIYFGYVNMAGSVFKQLSPKQGVWDTNLLCFWTFVRKDMNLLDRNTARARATCADTKPPCFASVMPESPQTMISLVANYAAGITALPRKTGLHYCRAATQNILCGVKRCLPQGCFSGLCVSLGSNLPARG